MKLKEGMYIRYLGNIAKIIAVLIDGNSSSLNRVYVDNETVFFSEIEKASFDLIDLIEVGDYVNGKEVSDVMKNNDGDVTDIAYTEEVEGQSYSLMPIKKIVTKEQFNSMQYEVK